MIVTLRVASKFVPRDNPVPLSLSARGKLGLSPVLCNGTEAANPQISELASVLKFMFGCMLASLRASQDFASLIIHYFGFIAGHGEPAASCARLPRAAGQKHVQHFSGTDPIENL